MELNKLYYKNILISILLLMAASYVYNKFKINVERDDKIEELNIIKKYLLQEDQALTLQQLSSIKKPIIWIHIEYSKNSRSWLSFGSRNSLELNQDYLYLTIRSIINCCSDYFHIVLIDDDSFKILLENWNVDLNKLENPQKDYMRKLALTKILYNYGGLLIESSFILFKSLKPIYDKVLKTNKMCVAEFPNRSSNSHSIKFMPSMSFMGCVKNCPLMHEFCNHLEILISQDYTNQINVEDLINKWLFNNTQNNNINYIDGIYIGTKTSNNKSIDLEQLLGCSYLDIHEKSYGLYIPKDELLKRNAYNWFVYLNSQQVLQSNTNLGKYLLFSNNN